MGESDDAGSGSDNDEWRGFDVDETAAQKLGVGVVDEQTDEGKRQDVEERDAPEDLFDRRGQGPGRVLGLSSSKSDQLSTREGEGGCDEDTAEADEVGKRAGVIPSSATLVFRVPVVIVSAGYRVVKCGSCLLSVGWSTATDEDHTHEQENNDRRELQNRDPEFLFGIPKNTKQADDADCEEE